MWGEGDDGEGWRGRGEDTLVFLFYEKLLRVCWFFFSGFSTDGPSLLLLVCGGGFFFGLGQGRFGLVWGRILPTFDDTLSALPLAGTGVRRMTNHFMTDMILLIITVQKSVT